MFALKTIGEISTAFSCPSWLKHSDLVLVHTGNLNLEDNLTLDWEAGWDDGGIVATLSVLSPKGPPQDLAAGASIRGLCIDGDLHIAGALVNASADSGPMLLVAGSLSARQVSCGGAHVEIGGDLRVEEVVYGHYNHGQLIVGGQLFAQALINDDHFVDVRETASSNKVVYIDISRERDPDDDDRVPVALKKLLKKSPLSLGVVLDGLRKGRSLASMASPQTLEEWRDVVWRDYTRAAKIPKELRAEATYLALLAPQCPLRRPEILELVSMIPSKQLTPAVRRACFMLAPKSLLMLPSQFDLQREYEECFLVLDDPQKLADEIPAQFMSPAMTAYLNSHANKLPV